MNFISHPAAHSIFRSVIKIKHSTLKTQDEKSGVIENVKGMFAKRKEKIVHSLGKILIAKLASCPMLISPKNLTLAAINMSRSSHGSIFKTRKDRRGRDRKY